MMMTMERNEEVTQEGQATVVFIEEERSTSMGMEDMVEAIEDLKMQEGVENFLITEKSSKGERKFCVFGLSIEVVDDDIVMFDDLLGVLSSHLNNAREIPYICNMFSIEGITSIEETTGFRINFNDGYIKIEPII